MGDCFSWTLWILIEFSQSEFCSISSPLQSLFVMVFCCLFLPVPALLGSQCPLRRCWGKSSCTTRSAAASCPLQPFLGREGQALLALEMTWLEGDVSVAGPIKRFNKQPEGSSSALLSYLQGSGTSPVVVSISKWLLVAALAFTALPGAFLLPLL